MSEMTGRDKPVVAFDCDGTLTDAGVTVIGQDNGQTWDVTPMLRLQYMGATVCVMTCNNCAYVVRELQRFGFNAYVDPDITDPAYKCPPDDGRVMVTNRKVLADLYVDDNGLRWHYGDDFAIITSTIGI